MMRIVFKVCNATFICGFFIYFMLQETYPLLVLEALTYQGMMMLSLYTLSALLDELLPNMKDVTNYLQNLSFPLAIFISNISWGLGIPVDLGGLWTFKNHFFHTFNSLCCIMSMLTLEQVWSEKKCFIPFLYGLGYAAFSGIIQFKGFDALYPFLDFKNDPVTAAVIVVIAAIQIPIIHVGFCTFSNYIGNKKRETETTKDD
eukprot:GFUD01034993.1.p1 GENE.GFUD01034993.1~~GFUD01034993.1.p1  ORF type:complete len:202 (+),score=10.95 GFUD01034993.1:53-658(+)